MSHIQMSLVHKHRGRDGQARPGGAGDILSRRWLSACPGPTPVTTGPAWRPVFLVLTLDTNPAPPGCVILQHVTERTTLSTPHEALAPRSTGSWEAGLEACLTGVCSLRVPPPGRQEARATWLMRELPLLRGAFEPGSWRGRWVQGSFDN